MIANRKNLLKLVRLSIGSVNENVPARVCVASYQVDDCEPVKIFLLPVNEVDDEEFRAFQMSVEFHPDWDKSDAMLERLESGRLFRGKLVKFAKDIAGP